MFHTNGQEEALKTLLKKRNLYTVLFLVVLVGGGLCGSIPVAGWYICTAALIVSGFFAGLGMLCINCYRFSKYGKPGGGLWWFLLFIFGFIIVPVITVQIVGRIKPLAEKLMGVTFE